MLGVYTYDEFKWPVLVMELMEYGTLAQLTLNDEELFVPMYVKLSILQDISAGLCYLHTMNPPILHCDLTPYNILLTADIIAKLADFGVAAKVEKGYLRSHGWKTEQSRYRKFRDGDDAGWHLDHESGDNYYTPSSEVFSFGCIACHIITQERNYNMRHVYITNVVPGDEEILRLPTRGFAAEGRLRLSLHRCQEYIHEISEGPVKQLIASCLVHNEKRRPSITMVYETITDIVTSKILI